MSARGEFLEHVLEMLKPIGAVRTRRMFGGYGLYCGDLFFGPIADDACALRAQAGKRK